jgi:hypothetical protein
VYQNILIGRETKDVLADNNQPGANIFLRKKPYRICNQYIALATDILNANGLLPGFDRDEQELYVVLKDGTRIGPHGETSRER